MKHRTILFYKDYFQSFFTKQWPNVQRKIIWTLQIVEDLAIIPEKFIKHLAGTKGLYEIRVAHGSDSFRVLCFFTVDKLVVVTCGFQKKTRKTSRSMLKKAMRIKKEYENEN